MRVVRLYRDEDVRYGLADEGTITLISDEPFAAWEAEGVIPFSEAHLLPPVVPTKIVCVGINYRDHAGEMGHALPADPVIFLKPPTAINGPLGTISLPSMSSRVDYEGELAVVIGRRTHDVSPEQAHDHVLGFTCANDVTARDLQKIDGQWTRGKGFDTFCPVGPWVDTDVDPTDLKIETYLNGEIKQQARTSDMIFDVWQIVSFVSKVMTLLPGDIILTGTPSGVGPMQRGDVVEVRIEGLGSLVNRVI